MCVNYLNNEIYSWNPNTLLRLKPVNSCNIPNLIKSPTNRDAVNLLIDMMFSTVEISMMGVRYNTFKKFCAVFIFFPSDSALCSQAFFNLIILPNVCTEFSEV